MGNDHKIIKGKIVTGGRSIEQIREANKGQNMSEEDFQNIQKAYDHFNGVIALFRLLKIPHSKTYYLAGWEQAYDEQIMLGMFYAEQANPFQDIYKDDLDLFRKDWQARDYDTRCAFALIEKDIEIIIEISGELDEGQEPEGG
ncbi:hypothetical protein J40TS1_34330 [Paenibacillus montaniterrae]|uniref:Uncharacterized protein n=1 Tax=Paenibacillus montaniterrae TaxID=429341 RepID=A0A919YSV6_9BACL|nr:hypothetical protein [Paenibacillus montaniterrae]GIP17791.1 hypothetical protein J40TS1_34330 [Paenibacillus montaniterrae]